jgi:hypothetical protein
MKRLLPHMWEGKYKVRGKDVQFLLPAGQAKATLTSERTRGWREIQSAHEGSMVSTWPDSI